MKARKVKGLDPSGPLGENAARIALVRLDELYSFAEKAKNVEEVKALHDMRIAAKRLRYVLELTAPCFGPGARVGAKEAKALQSLLGEIHDCDEMLPLIRRHQKRLRGEDVEAARADAPPDAEDLDPASVAAAPNRNRYRGLESLATYLGARRQLLYERFRDRWAELESDGFRQRVEAGVGQ